MAGQYLSIPEAAKLLKTSRVTVWKRVKTGAIPAIRVGKIYLIDHKDVFPANRPLTEEEKRQIEQAVTKTIEQYGEVLRRLGNE
ncbi:MAG: helix-turn-helix domain-containing protein [Candidatus Omnitrophica bacterium]|nr:helix-turn-helix domain-containing protein [Candidatus Omnitrophota bacterium]